MAVGIQHGPAPEVHAQMAFGNGVDAKRNEQRWSEKAGDADSLQTEMWAAHETHAESVPIGRIGWGGGRRGHDEGGSVQGVMRVAVLTCRTTVHRCRLRVQASRARERCVLCPRKYHVSLAGIGVQSGSTRA